MEEVGPITITVPGTTSKAMSVRITRTHIEGSRARKSQDMECLPLDLIPGWLFGIQTGRVKEEIRPKLLRYRREAFRVLWDAFKADILPGVDTAFAPPAEDLTLAEQNLAQVEALHNLARQQVAFERWLAQHDYRLDVVEGATLEAHEAARAAHARMDALELTISAGPTVTTAQAAAISSAVKALAAKLGEVEPDAERGNPYGQVYGRLYRVFSVSSYKAISLETFPAVMTCLPTGGGTLPTIRLRLGRGM